MTNIHYLPFINNSEAIAWRQNLEQAFMRDHKNDYERLHAARADSTDIVMPVSYTHLDVYKRQQLLILPLLHLSLILKDLFYFLLVLA